MHVTALCVFSNTLFQFYRDRKQEKYFFAFFQCFFPSFILSRLPLSISRNIEYDLVGWMKNKSCSCLPSLRLPSATSYQKQSRH